MTAIADILEPVVDYWAWRAVPGRVADLVKEGQTIKQKVKAAIKDLDRDGGYGDVSWHAEDKILHFSQGDWWEKEQIDKWVKALEGISGVKKVTHEAEWSPGDDAGYIKLAEPQRMQSMEWAGKPHLSAQTMLGGPNPLTSTIVSGLLGAGLGYGGGWLLEKLFPEKYVKPGRIRRNLALLGGLGGAALPAWRASAAVQNQGISGLTQQDAQRVLPWNMFSKETLAPEFKAATEKFAAHLGRQHGGSMYAESIPVDAFNNAVWQDVRPGAARDNPMGTKDPFGNNEQRMFAPTSPAVAAMASGVVSGVGSAKRKSIISPMDVAKGLISAGVGLAAAKVFGGLAGAFFGVTPAARGKLQDLGALGGLLTPIVGGMFR